MYVYLSLQVEFGESEFVLVFFMCTVVCEINSRRERKGYEVGKEGNRDAFTFHFPMQHIDFHKFQCLLPEVLVECVCVLNRNGNRKCIKTRVHGCGGVEHLA